MTVDEVAGAGARPSREARNARGAVAVRFLTNGALFANILPRYPAIKDALNLTNAQFGLAVAAFPFGGLVAGLAAGWLIRRVGSPRVAIGATLLASISFLLAGVAPIGAILAVGLFLAGAMDAITDVAQNSHGLQVQRLYGRSILNSFHAVWSIGAVLGGLMGALAAELAVPLAVHLGVSAVVFSALALASHRYLLTDREPGDTATEPVPGTSADRPARPTTGRVATGRVATYVALAALVVVGSSGALVEDAGSSWSAIYLSASLHASAFAAGAGFIALQGMQFIGRLVGDGWPRRARRDGYRARGPQRRRDDPRVQPRGLRRRDADPRRDAWRRRAARAAARHRPDDRQLAAARRVPRVAARRRCDRRRHVAPARARDRARRRSARPAVVARARGCAP